MRILYRFILLAGLAFNALAGTFNAKNHIFPNGLQLVVIENHLAPIVTINVCYKVGTADDPVNLVGVSHFLEHMMFKGTPRFPEVKKEVILRGGNVNAMTTPDSTTYLTNISFQHLEFILDLEADRMKNLFFTPQQVKSEKEVVKEERRMRLENNPLGPTQEAYLKALFWHHPYGVPPIGYPFHIDAYSYENVKDHYKKWYHPNNVIIILAGDVTFDKAKELVDKYFSPLKSHPLPARERVEEPDHQGVKIRLDSFNKRVHLTRIHYHYMAPNYTQSFKGMSKEHFRSLVLLSYTLGGNSTSRLYKKFVEELKIAVEADCDYNWHFLNPFGFMFNLTLAPGIETSLAQSLLEDTIKELTEKGITQEELDKAKRDLLANFAFAKDGNSQAATYFRLLSVGFTFEDIENWARDFKTVKLSAVNDAIKEVLSRDPSSILVIYPKA